MTELRAPPRYRKSVHSDSTFAWLFGLGVVFVALIGFEHYLSVQADKAEQTRQAIANEQQRQQSILVQQQEALRQHAEGREMAQRQRAYESAMNPEAARPRRDPYAAQRNAEEAIAIMHDSRRIQREWDQQQYSYSAPDPVIVGSSAIREPTICSSLRSERNTIETAMRRGFQNGQNYRDRLNVIWQRMVSLRCDMRRH